jgi:hypothetical protein
MAENLSVKAEAVENARCSIKTPTVEMAKLQSERTSRPKGLTMKRSMLPTTLVMPVLLYVPFHQVVHAYIDGGTISLIIQSAIGVFVGALVAIGLYWKRIKASVKNLLSRSKKSGEPGEEPNK